MHLPMILPGLLLSLLAYAQDTPHKWAPGYNYWVLEHDTAALGYDPSTHASLVDTAGALGVEVIGQLGALRDHWLVRAPKPTRSDQDMVMSSYHAIRNRAASFEHLGTRSVEALRARSIASSIRALLPQTLRKRTKRDGYFGARAPPPIRPTPQTNNTSVAHALALRFGIIDPIFDEQWHFVNEEFPQHMMNVTPVWELGITGKGVFVAMVDDGIEYEHNDIKQNFFAEGSYDFNDHEPLPKPKLFDDHHGTRCAGEISAVKNDVCGIGIAYNSKIAGLRILSGPISDADEALALNYAYQNTSIYSCSWGPPDDGRSMEAPSYIIQKAVLEGIQNGRGGKGSIFVFASGNGAASGDQCNFDGYTNSIFSVTVAAVDYKGLHPYYSEACAANMIVTYSSGSGKNIHTTDIGQDKCTSVHGGTSAAAPIASAVFALALEARPDLTWRDIQHLCVASAMIINPDDPDWETTATGRRYSYKYGYGRLDASRYVNAAMTWELVKPQAWVDLPISELGEAKVDSKGAMLGGLPIVPGGIGSALTVSHDLLVENNFEKLEHITITVWINHTTRGDVEVDLRSPNGIRSVLAGRRKYDKDANGFPGWTFMTIKHWDEDPIGDWTLKVLDQSIDGSGGKLLGWTMSLFGSSIDASKAVPYTLNQITASPGNPLPPPSPTQSDGGTKWHSKPTTHLPGNHSDAEGEADKTSFGQGDTTPDQGYFQGMAHLLSNSTWLIGAFGAVVLFSGGAAYYFWRRRERRKARYVSIAPGEDVPMVDQGGRTAFGRDGGRTKELYDAFGEVSDDEADEETGLHRPPDSTRGLGYHSGFLEDDNPPSATGSARYRDEPDEDETVVEEVAGDPPRKARSGSSGSGDDGSWEHASQPTRVEQ